jgi:hypothetical protein
VPDGEKADQPVFQVGLHSWDRFRRIAARKTTKIPEAELTPMLQDALVGAPWLIVRERLIQAIKRG